MDQPGGWPVTGERVLGSGTFTTLLQDDITAPDGSTLQREYPAILAPSGSSP